jgi:YVTN family beta-propeller protein
MVDVRPRGIVVSPDGRRVHVAAEIGGTLTTIDATTNAVLTTLRLPGSPAKPVGVAVARDGTVYVANGRANSVTVVDASGSRVLRTFAVGQRPWGIDVTASGHVITANGASDDISVTDPSTGRVISTIKVGKGPWGIAAGR